MHPYPPVPPQAPPPPRPRRSTRRAVLLGVLVALVADLIVLGLLPGAIGGATPTLPGRTPTAGAGLPGLPGIPGGPTAPGTTSPTRAPASARPFDPNGAEVRVDDDIRRGLALIRVTMPNQSGAGTGMVLTSDGQVLTNYHVVRSTSLIRVTIASTGARYDATLVGRDATKDVALLQLRGASGLETITPDQDPVSVGDVTVAAGNADGQGYISAFSGRVTATDRSIRVRGQTQYDPEETLTGLVETTAHAEPGDSGGAMFDSQLEVLGMTTAGSTTGRSASYAVPIADALAVVDQVRRGDESGTVVIGPKPYLGIVAQRAESSRGVAVQSVENGSAASRAGLRAGDTIVALDGVSVRSHAELSAALDRLQPGQRVPIVWISAGGAQRTADVTLGTSSLN